MIDRKRDIGGRRLTDRLAVVPGLGTGQHVEVLLHSIGDLQQDVAAFGGRGFAPRLKCGVRSIESSFDVLLVRAGYLCERLTVNRRDHVEILAALWGGPFAADVVFVLFFEFRDVKRLFYCVHIGSFCTREPEGFPADLTRNINIMGKGINNCITLCKGKY